MAVIEANQCFCRIQSNKFSCLFKPDPQALKRSYLWCLLIDFTRCQNFKNECTSFFLRRMWFRSHKLLFRNLIWTVCYFTILLSMYCHIPTFMLNQSHFCQFTSPITTMFYIHFPQNILLMRWHHSLKVKRKEHHAWHTCSREVTISLVVDQVKKEKLLFIG